MSNNYDTGDTVSWHWSRGEGHGRVTARFERRVQRTIKGAKIVRNGTKDNPAYLIETGDSHVLKRGSELRGG